MHDLIELGNTVILPVLLIACTLTVLLRLRGTTSGILGAIGFGVLALIALFYSYVYVAEVAFWEWPPAMHLAIHVAGWAAWVLITAALFALPRGSRRDPYARRDREHVGEDYGRRTPPPSPPPPRG